MKSEEKIREVVRDKEKLDEVIEEITGQKLICYSHAHRTNWRTKIRRALEWVLE